MKIGFDGRAVYVGDSLPEVQRIRRILDENGIGYECVETDHEKDVTLPGRGAGRSFGWNFSDEKKVYEIRVAGKNYENAGYLIRKK